MLEIKQDSVEVNKRSKLIEWNEVISIIEFVRLEMLFNYSTVMSRCKDKASELHHNALIVIIYAQHTTSSIHNHNHIHIWHRTNPNAWTWSMIGGANSDANNKKIE